MIYIFKIQQGPALSWNKVNAMKINLYCPVRLYLRTFEPMDKYFNKHLYNETPDEYDGVRGGCQFDVQNAKFVNKMLSSYLDSCNSPPSIHNNIKSSSLNIEESDNRLWLCISHELSDESAEHLDIDSLKMETCHMLESIQGNLVRRQLKQPILTLFEASANWYLIYNSDLPDMHYFFYNELLTEFKMEQNLNNQPPLLPQP